MKIFQSGEQFSNKNFCIWESMFSILNTEILKSKKKTFFVLGTVFMKRYYSSRIKKSVKIQYRVIAQSAN